MLSPAPSVSGAEPVEPRGEQRPDGGRIVTSDSSPTTFHCRSTRWRMPSSASMPIISSRNSGLPSAAELMRAAAASGRFVVPSRSAISPRLSASSRGSTASRSQPRLPCPTWALLEQVRPRRAEHQDRSTVASGGEVLDHVEKRRLRPVDVLEDQHDGMLACHRLEQPPHGPEDLLPVRRCVRGPDRTRQPAHDLGRVLLAVEQAGQLSAADCGWFSFADARGLPQDLRHRPGGDAFAVGQATPAQNGRAIVHRRPAP